MKEFIKDSYIVVTIEEACSFTNKDFCYKIIETGRFATLHLDNTSTSRSVAISANPAIEEYRMATEAEGERYEREGKPYNVEVVERENENENEEAEGFEKGQYIVVLTTSQDYATQGFCYKVKYGVDWGKIKRAHACIEKDDEGDIVTFYKMEYKDKDRSWRFATQEEIDRYNTLEKPYDVSKVEGFDPGQYIVVKTTSQRYSSLDFCYKVKDGGKSPQIEKDNDGDSTLFDAIEYKNKDRSWRFATTEEITEYENLGKPYSTIDGPKRFSLGDYIVITTKESLLNSYSYNFIYKQNKIAEVLHAEDDGGDDHNCPTVQFDNKETWRYATDAEIKEYEKRSRPRPFNVSSCTTEDVKEYLVPDLEGVITSTANLIEVREAPPIENYNPTFIVPIQGERIDIDVRDGYRIKEVRPLYVNTFRKDGSAVICYSDTLGINWRFATQQEADTFERMWALPEVDFFSSPVTGYAGSLLSTGLGREESKTSKTKLEFKKFSVKGTVDGSFSSEKNYETFFDTKDGEVYLPKTGVKFDKVDIDFSELFSGCKIGTTNLPSELPRSLGKFLRLLDKTKKGVAPKVEFKKFQVK